MFGARPLEPYWIVLSLALPLFYIYFRTLNVFLLYDDLSLFENRHRYC